MEIGSVMFGRHADGTESPRRWNWCAWPCPRRTYTQSHIDYVGEVILAVAGGPAASGGIGSWSRRPGSGTSPPASLRSERAGPPYGVQQS